MLKVSMLAVLFMAAVSGLAQSQPTNLQMLVGRRAIAQRTPFYQPGTYKEISKEYAGQEVTIIAVKPSASFASIPFLTPQVMASLPPASRASMENLRNAATIIVQFADGTKADTGAAPVMPSMLSNYLELIPEKQPAAQVANSQPAIPQQPLNNESVVKLLKAGMSEDLIVSAIDNSPGGYDTSADGLISLKGAGATDKVIACVLLKNAAKSPSSATPPADASSVPTVNGPQIESTATPDHASRGLRDPNLLTDEQVSRAIDKGLSKPHSIGLTLVDMQMALLSGLLCDTCQQSGYTVTIYTPEGWIEQLAAMQRVKWFRLLSNPSPTRCARRSCMSLLFPARLHT